MSELIQFIKNFGADSLNVIWFPLLIWSVCCIASFLVLKYRQSLNPLYHYHLRTAALLSLPIGIAVSYVLNLLPALFASPELDTAFFVVQNPIKVVPLTPDMSQPIIQWNEPSFYIGVFTFSLLLGSAIMLFRLLFNYIQLRLLYQKLDTVSLAEVSSKAEYSKQLTRVRIAFNNHPLVPFTFGWKNPIIVLPSQIKHDDQKLNMALEHELVHIKRKDFLLQLLLSLIESLFWFHPLIKLGNKEIDTYREISCDQEVLSKNNFSTKSYASLLYELLPLQTGPSALSVSMAVKKSTLRKRIKTMKYHKMYRSSFKQSIILLLLMTLGITLPIACSDLRGPSGFGESELVHAKADFNNVTLEINEQKVESYGRFFPQEKGADSSTAPLKQISLNQGLIFGADAHGIIVLSGLEFEGAKRIAQVQKNTLRFHEKNLSFKLIKENGNILDEEATLWVRYFPTRYTSSFNFGTIPSSTLTSGKYINTLPPEYLGDLDLSGDLDFSGDLDTENNTSETEDDFFVVVEQMPELIGGMKELQSHVQYPDMARRAGIEGRVTIQFIVNETGDVENPRVVRGIGGGCDEEALYAVKQAKFKPGKQRGRPVRVQYALSVNFRIQNAKVYSSTTTPKNKKLSLSIIENKEGTITGKVTDMEGNHLKAAHVAIVETNQGTATDTDGYFTLENVTAGPQTILVSYIGFDQLKVPIDID
ncbi:MAG: TonB family protein [Balneolaceae bacterium]|nr:TonB family protein [Balneolaceae bacterium]